MNNRDKLLIISHTPLSDHSNNGKTLTAMFDFLNKDQIAQLYFNNSTPSFTICENYYKISDSDIIKKYIFKKNVSHFVKRNHIKTEDNFVSNIPNKFLRKISKSNFMRIIRNMWWEKYTISDELLKWIKDFSPTKILVVVGGDIFSVKIANQILDSLDNVDNFMYFTDDYLLNKKSNKSILNYLYKYNDKYFEYFRKLDNKTYGTFVISEKLKQAYEKEISSDIWVVMNNVIPKNNTYERKSMDYINIAYFGGLSIKRDEAIRSVANILEKNKINSKINIYTSKSNENLIPTTERNKYSKIISKGFIENAQELETVMDKYDFLLHIESHDKKMFELTKYSISTKIPEYLNAKKPIISYGPREQASIEYLLENNLSIYMDNSLSKDQINFLLNENNISEMVKRYSKIIDKNHDKTKQQELIKNSMNFK